MGLRGFVRVSLESLLAFMALCAFGGGIYGMLGAEEVPVAWLAGTPFPDYFVPSLILFAVVGGSAAAASVAIFLHKSGARNLALLAAVLQLGWIGAQVALIGFVSWLQPVVAVYAAVTLLLALAMPRGAPLR